MLENSLRNGFGKVVDGNDARLDVLKVQI